jgi:protein ImuB
MRKLQTTRTCVVWCPDWPVVAARQRDAGLRDVPVVVRERVGSRDLVRAASAEARREGVARGMRRREAEARCPGVAVIDADLALEARTFEVVARAVETVTPRVVLDRPGRCGFPTRGSSRYFGGDDALAARIVDAVLMVLGGGSDVRVGVADGVFTARLAARRAQPVQPLVVDPGNSAEFLAPWPVAVFEDEELANLLVRLGLRTLGDVAALPPDAVLARFGIEGREFHELARGLDPGPPVLVTPPPDLIEQIELDPPATRVDVAAFAAKGLADRLLTRLDERGLACTRVVIEAETEHGERLARSWRHEGALSPATLAERVRWQLDGWLTQTLAQNSNMRPRAVEGDIRAEQDLAALTDAGLDSTTGALTLVRLVPDEVVPALGRQLGFWGGDQAAHDRADRALARVQGMLGYDAVATAIVQGGRTPAEQVRWVPWGEPREPERPLDGKETPGWPGAVPPPFPARVFTPPIPAAFLDRTGRPIVVSGRGEHASAPARLECRLLPDGGGVVQSWAGPWAHDLRWWDPRARRRRVLWQVVVDGGPEASAVACLVAVEGGSAGVEAIYD